MNEFMWHSLKGKKIWVFGGAGYLGSAITKTLDAQCDLTLCIDLDSKAHAYVSAERLCNTCPLTLDTSKIKDLAAFVEQTIHQHGLPDGMVNLTYASSVGKKLEEISPEEFARPFDESVTSFFVLARALAEKMKSRGSGSFVNFASMYGLVSPDPSSYGQGLTPNPIDYGASKAAIIQMSRYMAVHYGASGLRFNCVVPGPFPNPAVVSSHPDFVNGLAKKTPLNRVASNHEIVGPTMFLLADGSSYVTGQCLVVDGGWTAW